MIDLSNISDIYITSSHIDFRKSIDGLVAIIKNDFNMSIYDNNLFIFCSKTKDKVKIIHYEHGGVWLYYKRLDKDKFTIPKNLELTSITPQQLRWLLEGLTMFPRRQITTKHYAEIA